MTLNSGIHLNLSVNIECCKIPHIFNAVLDLMNGDQFQGQRQMHTVCIVLTPAASDISFSFLPVTVSLGDLITGSSRAGVSNSSPQGPPAGHVFGITF